MLFSSYASNQLFEVAWRKLETAFAGRNIDYVAVDGAAPENKDARAALWGISGVRAYPQVFIKNEFIGDMDKIQEMMDCGGFGAAFDAYIK